MSHEFGNGNGWVGASPMTDGDRSRSETASAVIVLLFNRAHQLLLRRAAGGRWQVSATGVTADGETADAAAARLAGMSAMTPVRVFDLAAEKRAAGAQAVPVYFATVNDAEANGAEYSFFSIEEIRRDVARAPADFEPEVAEVLAMIRPHLIRVPYLEKGEHDYNYRFRPERDRNREVYRVDERSLELYQSDLCQAIKEVKRVNERSSSTPALLDFGAVSYALPSHFGFCLGVQNAIERAYECIAENPGRTVYMLSELIHNPFVNEDLSARGLRYLQSDQGRPLADPTTGVFYWDLLKKDDVVIIPAFGATDEDKTRLIEKGIAINRYDATCMLVEKVWKAARRFGRAGYTVIIHGKAEHEETKATFSNAANAGPALIVRDAAEAELLAAVILADDPAEKQRLFEPFKERHTTGFDVERDLERVAVVNQTTLLRNETLRIIARLEEVFAKKFGEENVGRHMNSNSKGDTLCYATQVNQDALEKALALDLDFAVVAGGKNSSNTYQLFRMCRERLADRAHYIQSERNILPDGRVIHLPFGSGAETPDEGGEERSFLDEAVRRERPVRILITGGASCPDGIIQQIIFKINSFFPRESLRPVSDVLAELERMD